MNRSKFSRHQFATAAFCFAIGCCLVAVGVAADKAKNKKPKSAEAIKTHEVKFEAVTLRIPDSWEEIPNTSKLNKLEYKIAPVKGDSEPALFIMSFYIGGRPSAPTSDDSWNNRFLPEGRRIKETEGNSPQGKYSFSDVTGTLIREPGSEPVADNLLKNARLLSIDLTTPQDNAYYLILSGPEKTVTTAAKAFRGSIGADEKKEKPVKTLEGAK